MTSYKEDNTMSKNDIIRKLTSRKLWLAVAGFVAGLIVAFDGTAETAETVSGLILQAASILGYIIAEGLADAAHTDQKEGE
jgi:hypothetical protein